MVCLFDPTKTRIGMYRVFKYPVHTDSCFSGIEEAKYPVHTDSCFSGIEEANRTPIDTDSYFQWDRSVRVSTL